MDDSFFGVGGSGLSAWQADSWTNVSLFLLLSLVQCDRWLMIFGGCWAWLAGDMGLLSLVSAQCGHQTIVPLKDTTAF